MKDNHFVFLDIFTANLPRHTGCRAHLCFVEKDKISDRFQHPATHCQFYIRGIP